MDQVMCPNCHIGLVEDAAEDLTMGENGKVTVDGFLAYVCPNHCGYFERMPKDGEFPRAIADRGDALLLLYPHNEGRIYDRASNVLYPPKHYEAHVKFGYWEPYTGNEDIKAIDRYARKLGEPKSLFEFATSELSQDAFLCWLIQWADPFLSERNRPLHRTALRFIEEIFKKHRIKAVPAIQSVEIIRQFQSLDILVLINEDTAILIEDKTYTKDHSNQLIRYKEAVQKAYPTHRLLPVYYKSASQSHYRSCDKARYVPFLREDMLAVLREGVSNGVQNDIFFDYVKRLEQIEAGYQSYKKWPVEKWNSFSWQGFFRRLQEEIEGNWGYVPNQNGGFQAFWWGQHSNSPYYFQIEETRLCIKIVEEQKEKQRTAREKGMASLLHLPLLQELSFRKPHKSGLGKTMTVLVKDDYVQTDDHRIVNMPKTIELLKRLNI